MTTATVWTVSRVLEWTSAYLERHGRDGARLDAEILLADTLGVPRLELYLGHDRVLLPEESASYKERVRRRARRLLLLLRIGGCDGDAALLGGQPLAIPRRIDDGVVGVEAADVPR